MQETANAVPGMRFRMEDLQLVADGPAKYLFWAEGAPFTDLEAALETDPTVTSFTCLAELGDRNLYRVSFTDEMKAKMTYLDASANDIVFLELSSVGERSRIRARVPHRDALHTYIDACRAKDIPVRVESLYVEDSDGPTHRFGLTEQQYEALVESYEAGYFESERQVTLADIATDLGITRQALAGRLRRGHKQLIAATLT